MVGTFEESERVRRLLFDVEEPGTRNILHESPAKHAKLLNIIRSAKAPVSVDEAEKLMHR
jgi:hypothetical protein